MAVAKRKYAAGLNARLFKALAHPIQYPILMIAGERPVSPTELAEMLDEDFQRVYAQVRLLARQEGDEPPLLELVETDTRKGGEQHFYQATVRPVLDGAAWDDLPQLAKESDSAIIGGVVVREMASSVASGAFDSNDDRALIRRPLRVDEAGMRKIAEAMIALDEVCADVERESAERGTPTINTLSVLMHFPRGDDQKR